MKYFLIALLTIFTLQACGDSPTEPDNEFEPYRVGTWWVHSEDAADWEGENSKQKITTAATPDTVFLEQPNGRDVEMEKPEDEDDRVVFTFIDSTVTKADSIDGYNYFLKNDPEIFTIPSAGSSLTPDRLKTDFDLVYRCEDYYPTVADTIVIDLLDDESELIRRYMLKTDGMIDVIDDMVCD